MCMWKIIFIECRPVGGQLGHWDPNAIAAQKMRGGKHVKVKKRGRQDICVFAPTREN